MSNDILTGFHYTQTEQVLYPPKDWVETNKDVLRPRVRLIGQGISPYALTKRAIDVGGALIGLILLSPIMGMAAILIKLTSKGKVFYSQVRVGKDGRNFDIYKLRTMTIDAEKKTGPVWASRNDKRIVPIGKFLRAAHIDEIPQFINVLKGEMSIIGPRPERPVFVNQFIIQISDYGKRLDVKPGITGLAQVRHRYDATIDDVKKKVKYDLLYIRKMCLLTDVMIIARTVHVILFESGTKSFINSNTK